jgi:hypothetical protein
MIIRIIIDYNNSKQIEQYNQLRNLLSHILYIYNKGDTTIYDKVDFNIYIDTISEVVYKLCPAEKTILLVNEEYIDCNLYMRREYYLDKSFIALNEVVDYYICQTKYACKQVTKKCKIKDKNKILYYPALVTDIYSPNIDYNKKKYILYDIDLYSCQQNYILLKTWLTHFTNRSEILIIIYKYSKDKIITCLNDLINEQKLHNRLHNKFCNIFKDGILECKNIIITNDQNIDKYNIYAIIINTSYYSLTTKLYENILKKRIIITIDNDISREILLNKDYLIDTFDIDNLHISLTKLFNTSDNIINNIVDNEKQKILDTPTNKLYDFFQSEYTKLDNKVTILNNRVTNFSNESRVNEEIIKDKLKGDELFNKMNQDHINITTTIKNINLDKKIKNINYKKCYKILKTPKNKTDFAYATIIILNNTYLPSILATGFNLKYHNNVAYNLVCFVQRGPYKDENGKKIYENGEVKFPGLTDEEIKDICKIYDCVVSIDLLEIQTDNINITRETNRNHYRNSNYYATKLWISGFIYYKKILYYDASTLITKNIDTYFENNKSMYYNKYNKYDRHSGGLIGNIIFIIPKEYYIKKNEIFN